MKRLRTSEIVLAARQSAWQRYGSQPFAIDSDWVINNLTVSYLCHIAIPILFF
jgi:hypothetical protein